MKRQFLSPASTDRTAVRASRTARQTSVPPSRYQPWAESVIGGCRQQVNRWFLVARGRCLLEPHSMRGRPTMRDLSVFGRLVGLPNDGFRRLPWRSISAEQPGGLDTKAAGLEPTHGHRYKTHHLEPQRRESYLVGCVRIVDQAPRGVGCLDVAICADLVDPAVSTSSSAGGRRRRWRPSAAAALIGTAPGGAHGVRSGVRHRDVRPVFGEGAE
jgi:hypothetical protein